MNTAEILVNISYFTLNDWLRVMSFGTLWWEGEGCFTVVGVRRWNDWDLMNKIPLLGGKILLPWPWVSPEKLSSSLPSQGRVPEISPCSHIWVLYLIEENMFHKFKALLIGNFPHNPSDRGQNIDFPYFIVRKIGLDYCEVFLVMWLVHRSSFRPCI